MTSVLRGPPTCIRCGLQRLFSSTASLAQIKVPAQSHSTRKPKVADPDEKNAARLKRQYNKLINSSDRGPRDRNPAESPKSRADWSHLPDWRRQNLSIRHKLTTQSHTATEDGGHGGAGGAVPASSHWSPRKKLSPDAMAGIRTLQRTNPEYDVPRLADLFKVSPDAIRRILKSKWIPTPQEAKDRDERWKKRKLEIAKVRFSDQSG
ncbi:Required for respiratory growth protein 9, mitochondrial [Taphrina deformans PYCC 5710]|uniref:Required for respiratory growth protein 9, mitochondrial n=1 Tax=Taphrina deformans (strain PYCC 5710 / ATCC 11124 / CBS 356.35 / IMI 108563 / JCM 9778 / NBRC 8474) TaxID=1097556 RepID=R4XD43_TAPDE|nr:Required for respiratory growth protein 9, mitochondrial [Taphrina deformans PYCC 5710]|eukprot:CCG82328.1 Required for respiratory growth protein 9, mitochondrial [Taphrina deformans PYCC 5710]